MVHEVALIEWSDATGGMRLLGRSRDPQVIAAVREHLADSFLPTAGRSSDGLRLVRGGITAAERSQVHGDSEGEIDG